MYWTKLQKQWNMEQCREDGFGSGNAPPESSGVKRGLMETLYWILLWCQLGLVLPVLIFLLFVKAPYGKFASDKTGLFRWDSRAAWLIMELPAFLTILVLFLLCPDRSGRRLTTVFLLFWECHYGYRTFVFPLLMKKSRKSFPAYIVFSAWFFNIMNGYINGYFLFFRRPGYEISWLTDLRFIAGAALFLWGFTIHVRSDARLRKLRKENGPGYYIPRGGLYEYVSNPNYLGEWIEWCGWALMTWSLPGLAFAAFTFANLFPRAVANHRWYREHFPDYPARRKAFLPGIL